MNGNAPGTVCFTGYRPNRLFGYKNRDDYRPLLDVIIELSCGLVESGYRTFITGGAQGTDQLAFWAVETVKRNYPDLSIRSEVYIPFVGQDRRWSEDGPFGRHEYRQMLDAADRVHVVCDSDINVCEAMARRNEEMVADATCVIGVIAADDDIDRNPGGTARTLRIARRVRRRIITIDPTTLAVGRSIKSI